MTLNCNCFRLDNLNPTHAMHKGVICSCLVCFRWRQFDLDVVKVTPVVSLVIVVGLCVDKKSLTFLAARGIYVTELVLDQLDRIEAFSHRSLRFVQFCSGNSVVPL